MLICEGYKMFKGTARIVPSTGWREPFEETGTWLYKPECNCWYVNGHSFPADIVTDFREEEKA